MPQITPSSHVTLHYRMALLVDGAERELVNTFPAAPATLQMGVGQWSPALEQRLLGLAEGAACEFELPPDQAYGVHHPELVRRLPRAQVQARCAAGAAPAVGEAVEFPGPDGTAYRGVLTECGAEEAVLDFNHPLAGLPMRLRVQVIGVL
jgi:FKBP-type peptidyl-prolyl cis-trans isomerase SlpA